MSGDFKKEGLMFWVTICLPIIIAGLVLVTIFVGEGDVIDNNLGLFTIHMVYRFSIIVIGVELLNKVYKRKEGGIKNE